MLVHSENMLKLQISLSVLELNVYIRIYDCQKSWYLVVKYFNLESQIFGTLLLYILKRNNLIHMASSWSIVYLFHFHEIFSQMNQNSMLFFQCYDLKYLRFKILIVIPH